MSKEIREKFKALRKELGLTQKELAEKIGLKERRIQSIESGAQDITLENLRRLSSLLKRDIIITIRCEQH